VAGGIQRVDDVSRLERDSQECGLVDSGEIYDGVVLGLEGSVGCLNRWVDKEKEPTNSIPMIDPRIRGSAIGDLFPVNQ
jgi:hypothetical protein